MFDYQIDRLPSEIAVVSVTGNLDDVNREYFFGCIEGLMSEGYEKIVIDCDGLGFVSSSGLASMLKARAKLQRQGGKIYLAAVNATIAEVLNISRLNRLFSIFPTRRDAVKYLHRDAAAA